MSHTKHVYVHVVSVYLHGQVYNLYTAYKKQQFDFLGDVCPRMDHMGVPGRTILRIDPVSAVSSSDDCC